MVTVSARRSRIVPGRADEYRTFHASIPAQLAEQLRECGVLRWEIWIDGEILFHRVVTTDGYDAMVERAEAARPSHPQWQATVDELLRSEPGDDVMLAPVWTMDETSQGVWIDDLR